VLAVAAVAVALGTGDYLRSRHGGGVDGPCVSVVVASTMGGATIERCGTAAVGFCRENANDPQIAAACRREGFGS